METLPRPSGHRVSAGTASAAADDFVAVVRGALRHLHDDRRLDQIPLAPRGATTTGRHGRALQMALREAISSLSPLSSGASLLRLRYVDGLAPPAVFRRLGMSQSEYYRQPTCSGTAG